MITRWHKTIINNEIWVSLRYGENAVSSFLVRKKQTIREKADKINTTEKILTILFNYNQL